MTWLFATASNRPAIAFAEAVQGSLHPASLLTGVVADLFGAHDPAVDYWGPYSEHWDARELFLSQNMTVTSRSWVRNDPSLAPSLMMRVTTPGE